MRPERAPPRNFSDSDLRATDESQEGAVPVCPRCGVRMVWYRSELQPDGHKHKLVAYFQCEKCGHLGVSEQPHRIALRSVEPGDSAL